MKVTVCCYYVPRSQEDNATDLNPKIHQNKITLPQVLDLLQHSAAGHTPPPEGNPAVALHTQVTREAAIRQQNSKTRERQLREGGPKAESELLHLHGSANETPNC